MSSFAAKRWSVRGRSKKENKSLAYLKKWIKILKIYIMDTILISSVSVVSCKVHLWSDTSKGILKEKQEDELTAPLENTRRRRGKVSSCQKGKKRKICITAAACESSFGDAMHSQKSKMPQKNIECHPFSKWLVRSFYTSFLGCC